MISIMIFKEIIHPSRVGEGGREGGRREKREGGGRKRKEGGLKRGREGEREGLK